MILHYGCGEKKSRWIADYSDAMNGTARVWINKIKN